MPTGYTASVQDGSITVLTDFAMRCARAMGACILLRDEPADAPIPEKFEPNISYNQEEGAEAQKRLLELQRMSQDEMNTGAASEYEQNCNEFIQAAAREERHRLRYKTMLEKVRAWEPPTGDHYELRTFMLEQLRQSIEFDCNGHRKHPKRLTPAEWYKQECENASKSLDRHNKAVVEEIKRTESRNAWLADLRKSLQ